MSDRSSIEEPRHVGRGGHIVDRSSAEKDSDRGGHLASQPSPDERGKFDHSDHPLDRSQAGDLHAPHSNKAEPPPRTGDSRAGVHQKGPVIPPDARDDADT